MQENTAIVRDVMVMDKDGTIKTSKVDRVIVDMEGFAGDRHSGLTMRSGSKQKRFYEKGTTIRNTRQVSIISVEDMAVVANNLDVPHVDASWLGSNLLIEGIEEVSQLPRGTRLIFSSGAALVVEEENHPCMNSGKQVQENYPERENMAAAFVKGAYRKRGVVAWVEKEGEIAVGDEVRVVIP